MAAEAKEIKVKEVKEAPVEETKQENVTTEQQQEQQVPAAVEQPKEGFLTKVKRVATEKVIPATKKAVSTGLKVGAGIAIGFGIAKVLGSKTSSSTSSSDVPEVDHKDDYEDVDYNEINNDPE